MPLAFALGQATRHLHTHIEHRLGDFDMLPLQEGACICRKIQSYQRHFIFGATQHDTPIRQLDDFQK